MIKKGDMFLVEGHPAMAPITNFFQRFWAKDDESHYAHSGIIIDDSGITFEARWKVESNNLFEKYQGKQVLIARYLELDTELCDTALKNLEKHKGEWFPMGRMILHALRIAKIFHWNKLVCSELVAKYLFFIGARHHHYYGTNVDDLADEFKNWKGYEVVFEGILE